MRRARLRGHTTMAKLLRQTGDEQMAAQRWQAQEAARQTAALNGELGVEAQILALSAHYMALRASGQDEAAAAIKARAYAIREAI